MWLENYVIYYIFLDFFFFFLLVNTIDTIVQGGVVINVFNLPGSSQTTQHNDHTTELDYWNLILSLRRPLQSFCQYLKNVLNVVVRRHDTGSLLLTVECRSLQILERLWKDYCSGHLNKMAQESLITAEVLEKLGLSEIKLKLFISEEEYERGKQIFRETKGDPDSCILSTSNCIFIFTHLYRICHHTTLNSSDGLPVCKLVLLSLSHGKMSNKNVQLVSKHCCKTS